MLVRLSSKGQIVIPKDIRIKMALHQGTQFDLLLQEGQIVLKPIMDSPVKQLYGKYAGVDLLGDLEEEHHNEIMDDAALYA